jgi:hypothetical protein
MRPLRDPRYYKKMNEWELAINHRNALKIEDYETCMQIQQEVDFRIANNTINHVFMNGFKYYDPELEKFTGDAKFEPYNGLFRNYKFVK